MSRACQHHISRIRSYIIQIEKSELIYVNSVFDCTTVEEAQGAMWVTCPSKALCGGKKSKPPGWMFAPITLPDTVDQCKGKKFPKDLCQISCLANDRKDEDLSQQSWVRVYPTLLHVVLPLFLSIKLESREIPASQDIHFSDHLSDSTLRASPKVHDISKDLWHIHYCCTVAEYSLLSQSQVAFGWWEFTLLRQLQALRSQK